MTDGTLLLAEEMRRIAREQAEEVASTVADKVLRAALSDIPTRDEIQRMFDAADEKYQSMSAKQGETYMNLFSSVDRHLREAEMRFDSGHRQFRESASEVKAVTGELRGIAEIVRASTERMNSIQDTVNAHGRQIGDLATAQTELRKDIFGDPTTPSVSSLVETIRGWKDQSEMARIGLVNQIEGVALRLDRRVEPLEKFVETHQRIEAQLLKVGDAIYKNRKLIVVALALTFGGLTIGSVEELVRLIAALFSGGG